MGIIGVLVALHPKEWRARYGNEFRALLEDTRLTPLAVANVVAHATRVRVQTHITATLVAVALVISIACEVVALRGGLTDNILWAPTDLPRALLLLGTVGPWLALILWLRRRVRMTEPSPDIGLTTAERRWLGQPRK